MNGSCYHQPQRTSVGARLLALCSLFMAAMLLIANANAAVSLRVVADRTPIDSTPVQVFVSVTDAGGLPVTNLAAPDFRLFEDGSEQTTTFTLPPLAGPAAVTVVFVMDYSGSLAASDIDAIENAVADFINTNMFADDVGAIVKFNNEVSLIAPPGFTADKAALEGAARSDFAPTGGGTRLYDALVTAVTELGTRAASLPPGPRAVVMLTDGRDNASTATKANVLALVEGTGIPVFAIAYGGQVNTSVLNEIATASNGGLLTATDAGALQSVYESIARQLQNEYLLTYSSAITDCNAHGLEVVVAGEHQSATFQRCNSVTAAAAGSGGGGGPIDAALLTLLLLAFLWRRGRAAERQALLSRKPGRALSTSTYGMRAHRSSTPRVRH